MTSVRRDLRGKRVTILRMKSRAIYRVLAVAHFLIAIPLLLVTGFFGLLLMPILAAGPVWLCILGRRLWIRTDFRVCRQIQITHVFSLLFAVLLCVIGVGDLQAAERSAAHGGGLLGGLGLIPVAMGIVLGVFAIATLVLVRPPASPAV